ncbi:low molecular weight phosphotyrosine protein phosphatase [Marinobacter sp. es.042]|uniref:arsenate reductase/protein-tyrosine-phosphatase family protein n=1 Tax=Marinobacter sp. es.042 TaxID=1761794 RepID=UPI000B5046EF|nr:hypothetical protein [Marinobacter sp. es.042]SNB55488.1 low molecular weight phosphotyrosine protein phosphatase [Marinobacter sp. es.042]
MIEDLIKDKYGSRRGLIQYHWDGLLTRVGAYQHRLPSVQEIRKVVFVCQGNICRSALAEVVFKKHSNVESTSVGLKTSTGKPANSRVVKYASSKASVDLSKHRTTRLEDYEVLPFDLFVCMEIRQIRELRKRGIKNVCVLLGSFGERQQARINDPYSANDRYMEKTVEDIVYHTVELAKCLER